MPSTATGTTPCTPPPGTPQRATRTAADAPGRRAPTVAELTGLDAAELDELITQLAALQRAQREERVRSHPASDARHKPRSGRPPVFAFPGRVVATLLHLRLTLPDDTLAHLFRTSRTTIRRALAQTRHLLDQHGLVIEPATAPPDLPARIPPHARQPASNPQNKIKAAR